MIIQFCHLKDFKFRALKDTGCQQNFILESLADKLNLKVIKSNVEILVNGINIPKKICDYVVGI